MAGAVLGLPLLIVVGGGSVPRSLGCGLAACDSETWCRRGLSQPAGLGGIERPSAAAIDDPGRGAEWRRAVAGRVNSIAAREPPNQPPADVDDEQADRRVDHPLRAASATSRSRAAPKSRQKKYATTAIAMKNAKRSSVPAVRARSRWFEDHDHERDERRGSAGCGREGVMRSCRRGRRAPRRRASRTGEPQQTRARLARRIEPRREHGEQRERPVGVVQVVRARRWSESSSSPSATWATTSVWASASSCATAPPA